ncbi:hypothetical protein SADUNF_Sadunf09G0033400 [Salix dunnii]|uniref:Uncharacterized protein n=1 Tax=Salix dunnii TaxID=1413687 RepID=A0A835JS30_9ROSI|nr:hypothetical protein SADUNF_Sadunf09G0033400 [Salix dunnii]
MASSPPGSYQHWVASHVSGNGPESWLNDHAAFDREKMWLYMCPANSGSDDPRLNPGMEDRVQEVVDFCGREISFEGSGQE